MKDTLSMAEAIPYHTVVQHVDVTNWTAIIIVLILVVVGLVVFFYLNYNSEINQRRRSLAVGTLDVEIAKNRLAVNGYGNQDVVAAHQRNLDAEKLQGKQRLEHLKIEKAETVLQNEIDILNGNHSVAMKVFAPAVVTPPAPPTPAGGGGGTP